MGELGTRWILAAGAICLAGAIGTPAFAWVVGVSVAWALASTGLLRFQRSNPGIAGFIAALDATAIAIILSSHSRLGMFAWLCALPALQAVLRYEAKAPNTLSLVASGVLASHLAVHGKLPNWILFAQVGGILAFGLVLRSQVKAAPQAIVGTTDPLVEEEAETYLGLRESFRKLKGIYRDLEWRSRRDRHTAHLLTARLGEPENAIKRLAEETLTLSGATHLTLYAASRELAGFVAPDASPSILRIDPDQAPGRIRHQADRLPASSGLVAAHVPLVDSGRVVGLCRLEASADAIDQTLAVIEEVAPTLGSLMVDAAERRTAAADLSLLRLRSEFLLNVRGFAQEQSLAQRAAEFLAAQGWTSVEVQRNGSIVARTGSEQPTWIESTEERIVIDTTHAAEFPVEEVLKWRIGCFATLVSGTTKVSVTGPAGLADHLQVELIRTIARDLDWVFSDGRKGAGSVSASDFRDRMKEAGILVLFEHRNKEGRVLVDQDSARLRRRLLDFLPARAALFSRSDGDILVHLPAARLSIASAWAEKAVEGSADFVVRTASLWPPTPAVIEIEAWEPEPLLDASVA